VIDKTEGNAGHQDRVQGRDSITSTRANPGRRRFESSSRQEERVTVQKGTSGLACGLAVGAAVLLAAVCPATISLVH